MALEIYNEFAPRATAPSAEYIGGSIKGESVSGANDGTLLKAILINDYVGFTDALLAEAKMTLTGDVDTALNSQRLTAIKYIIDARSSARSLGLSDSAVLVGEAGLTTTASNTHVLNVTNKLTYLLPSSVGTGETIVSLVGNTLVTSGGTYKLQSTGAINKVASSVLVNSESVVLAGGMVTITNGYFMFTDGMDANGFNVNTETFTGTVDFTGVGSGTYWVGRVAGGGWVFRTDKPVFNLVNGLFTGETEPLSFLKNAVVLLSSVPQSFGIDSIPENNTASVIESGYTKNLLAASQPIVQSVTGSTLPSGTATSYADGDEIAFGYYADGAVTNLEVDGFSNLVLSNTVTDTGKIYIECNIPTNKVITDLFGSVATGSVGGITTTSFTNAEPETGLTLSLVGGKARLTIDLALFTNGAFAFGISEQSGGVNIDNTEEIIRGKPVLLWSGSITSDGVDIDITVGGKWARRDFSYLKINAASNASALPFSGFLYKEDSGVSIANINGTGTSAASARIGVDSASESSIRSFIATSTFTGEITEIYGVKL